MKKIKSRTQLEQYLINKAWEWRRTGTFDDLETAKLIMKGKIKLD